MGRSKTHGMYKSPEYYSWYSMKQRCLNPKDSQYKYYGERGVSVCPEWMEFENFYADMGDRPEGMSLDRIESTGDYSKKNCRWANNTIQRINQRIRSNNTSGVKGVCWHKAAKKWVAYIQTEGKSIHLGSFDTKDKAIKARMAAEETYHQPLLEVA